MEKLVLTGTKGLKAAYISFNTQDYLAQGGKTTDFFIATDSDSPIILATGGPSQFKWEESHHMTIILCEQHNQGGRKGVRVRLNYVADQPVSGMVSLTLAQDGATGFATPEITTWGS